MKGRICNNYVNDEHFDTSVVVMLSENLSLMRRCDLCFWLFVNYTKESLSFNAAALAFMYMESLTDEI